MKCFCPFWSQSEGPMTENCVYCDKNGYCDEIEINPGNGDAWCNQDDLRSQLIVCKAAKEVADALLAHLDHWTNDIVIFSGRLQDAIKEYEKTIKPVDEKEN